MEFNPCDLVNIVCCDEEELWRRLEKRDFNRIKDKQNVVYSGEFNGREILIKKGEQIYGNNGGYTMVYFDIFHGDCIIGRVCAEKKIVTARGEPIVIH